MEFFKIHSYCTPWAVQWPLYERGNTSYAVSVRDLFAELLRLIYLSNSHSPLSLLSVLKWKQSWTNIFIFSISLKFTLRQLSYTVSSACERYYISCDTWAQCFICRPLNIDLTSLDPPSHQPPHIAQAYQLNWLPKPTVILRVVFLRFLLFFNDLFELSWRLFLYLL